MVVKVNQIVSHFICALLICLSYTMLLADTANEMEIVSLNGIQVYKIPAEQLISKAKEEDISVSERKLPDGSTEYIMEDSKLTEELLTLYDRAISQLSEYQVVIEYNSEESDNIIGLLQVNQKRKLITGVLFFGGKK